ncbi:MAG: helix-turn-helix domain-containing protein [Candidatus Aminicenantes bacterium]|nr:helix-turn-helix domain-containing protein [Candidatus Aminicenantes bacterium]
MKRLLLLLFRRFTIIPLLLLLWAPFFLMALDPDRAVSQYSIRAFNMESDLPANSIFALRQTRDGYLWIGTSAGLVRFDGQHFELYDKSKTPQLKSNEISALYEDRKGNLWIGADSGGLTRYKDGKFFTYPVIMQGHFNKIRAINEDRRGNLWIGSLTSGLACLRGDNITIYTKKDGLPDDRVKSIYKDEEEDLWVVTTSGIVKIDGQGNFQRRVTKEILPYYHMTCLYEADKGDLWIGTVIGLFRMKNGVLTAYGTEVGIPRKAIYSLYRDRPGNLWIGMEEGGLIRMRDGVSSTLPVEDGQAWGPVSTLYEDREGILWVGTLDGGLFQLRDSKFINYTGREGLTHNFVNCIYEDRAGNLLIGTKEGLNRLENGILPAVPVTGKGFFKKNVLQLFEDRRTYLWIGTLTGLYRFKKGKLSALTTAEGLSGNRINCIAGDSRGYTWVGTKNGLNRFDERSGRFTVFSTKDGLLSNHIDCIFEDSRGNFWIGTDTGLNFMRDGVFSIYNLPVKIAGQNFYCIYQDSEETLWFGTSSGLIRISFPLPGTRENKTGQTTLYTTAGDLIENYVYAILEDESGYLWLAGRNGISRIRKNELTDFAEGKIAQVHPDCYNEQDGMKNRWCTGTGCKTRDGRFWFPTIEGAAVIDPDRFSEGAASKTANNIPPPIIEGFIVDGEPIDMGGARADKPVTLAPGKKRLEFRYRAISFINPHKTRYKLKLAGYDSDWVDRENILSTIYTGLSPGEYTFEVKACDPDGIWSEKSASFSFYLKPYFYRTSLFFLAVFLLLAAALFFYFPFRQKRRRIGDLGLHPQPELLSPPGMDERFAWELNDIMDKNLSDADFNVDRLCKILKLSRATLYRKIHEISGENPTEFIRSYRLDRAAELLKKEFVSVLEVALEVGFSSSAYFTKCFKKKFLQLPSEYQAAHTER